MNSRNGSISEPGVPSRLTSAASASTASGDLRPYRAAVSRRGGSTAAGALRAFAAARLGAWHKRQTPRAKSPMTDDARHLLPSIVDHRGMTLVEGRCRLSEKGIGVSGAQAT